MDEPGTAPTTTEKAVGAVVKGYRLVDRVVLAAKLFVLVGLVLSMAGACGCPASTTGMPPISVKMRRA